VVFHDGVDEVIDGGVFVADEHFAVEHFVVFEDVVEHFFVEVFGGRGEVDFHTAGFFGLEVDVALVALMLREDEGLWDIEEDVWSGLTVDRGSV
jgi:hypothetical protein